MNTYITRPQAHRAVYWDGSAEITKEIQDYIHRMKNATSVNRLGVGAQSRSIRIYVKGRVIDLRLNTWLVHNTVTDELFTCPDDFFTENFKLTNAVDKAIPL